MLCLVAAFVLLLPQMAVAQGGGAVRFQQMIEISVKPGQELVFENYIKRLVAAADKTGSRPTWTTYAVSLGKPGATYRVALGFNSWADRDAWASVPMMLIKAVGQQEAERLMKEGGSATQSSISEVWENLPNLSANTGGGAAGGTPPNFVRVQIVRVQPAMSAAYEGMLAKFKPAYEAASKAAIGRAVLRVGTGGGYTYRRTQQFNKMSELDALGGTELLQKHFGAQWALMSDELNRMVTFRQEFISTRRADLSRTAPATSSR
ncbi:MAG: hypothetical protein ACT4QD_09505 [Acidobacteriota bacterium]